MAGHAAVAAQPVYWLTLDQNNTITAFGLGTPNLERAMIGQPLFDLFPHARSQLEPLYQQARATGRAEGTVLLDAVAYHVNIDRQAAGRLHIEWEVVGELDTRTLETLEVSLHSIAASLAAPRDGEARRPLLRLV